MKRLACLFLLWGIAGTASAESFVQQKAEEAVVGGVAETVWQLTYTNEPPQRIALHRYRDPTVPAIAALLYLPGTNMNGELKHRSERHNIWLYLAARGVEVYAMDYRTHFISHDYDGDLSFMRDWTTELFVADAARCAELVSKKGSGLPLFIAGFSRGVGYAYSLAGQVAFQGLIALDGSYKAVEPEPFDRDKAQADLEQSGAFAGAVSRRGYAARHELMRRAHEAPDGPAVDERYATAAEHLIETLYNAWGPGVLSNTRAAVTPIDVLAVEMDDYDWYFPNIQNIEMRSRRAYLDDPSTSLDDHFGKMTIPILYFGATNFGAESLLNGIYSAARSGSEDVTINVLENYGHLDVLFAGEAEKEVYSVVLKWIEERLQ